MVATIISDRNIFAL